MGIFYNCKQCGNVFVKDDPKSFGIIKDYICKSCEPESNPDMHMCPFCQDKTVMCKYCGYCWCTRKFISKKMDNNGLCARCGEIHSKIIENGTGKK